jgi:hypothetical protein
MIFDLLEEDHVSYGVLDKKALKSIIYLMKISSLPAD